MSGPLSCALLHQPIADMSSQLVTAYVRLMLASSSMWQMLDECLLLTSVCADFATLTSNLSLDHMFRVPAGESKEFTVKMSVGVVTAMAGFFMYSHCKLAAAAAKRAEEAKGLSPPHRSQDAGERAVLSARKTPRMLCLPADTSLSAMAGELGTPAIDLLQGLLWCSLLTCTRVNPCC